MGSLKRGKNTPFAFVALLVVACSGESSPQIEQAELSATRSHIKLFRARVVKPDGAGQLYLLDCYGLKRLSRTTGTLEIVAGSHKGGRFSPGATLTRFRDGPGDQALFACPLDLLRDGRGKVYVADWGNASIRVVDERTHTVSTLVGGGRWSDEAVDGPREVARLKSSNRIMMSLAWRDEEHLLVTDDSAIREVDLVTGAVTTLVGRLGQSGTSDGVGTGARFPWWVETLTPDGHGELLVRSYEHDPIETWGARPAPALRLLDPRTLRVTSLVLTPSLPVGSGGVGVYGGKAFLDNSKTLWSVDLGTGRAAEFVGWWQIGSGPVALAGVVDNQAYVGVWREDLEALRVVDLDSKKSHTLLFNPR
jgi:hypothetical protein